MWLSMSSPAVTAHPCVLIRRDRRSHDFHALSAGLNVLLFPSSSAFHASPSETSSNAISHPRARLLPRSAKQAAQEQVAIPRLASTRTSNSNPLVSTYLWTHHTLLPCHPTHWNPIACPSASKNPLGLSMMEFLRRRFRKHNIGHGRSLVPPSARGLEVSAPR